jgi:hypothetical protein
VARRGDVLKTENKLDWCKSGASQEELFVFLFGHTFGLKINPDKKNDPYTVDLIHKKRGELCELKTRRTPFFMSQKLYGVPVQYAVTINRNDIERYTERHPSLPLYFWVWWDTCLSGYGSTVKRMHGLWGIRLEQLVELCTPDRLHCYERRKNDTQGNAKDSYVVSVKDMKQLWLV